jgi:hypothetical protein
MTYAAFTLKHVPLYGKVKIFFSESINKQEAKLKCNCKYIFTYNEVITDTSLSVIKESLSKKINI